jgi:hypothetical protein
MKIACIGHCQLESLAWYIKYLLPNDECWWVAYNKKYGGYNFNGKLKEVNGELLTKDFIDNVKCPHDKIDYVKSCDYIIYIPMTESATSNYHTKKIKTYFKDGSKSISVANYYIDNDKYTESLKETNKREIEKGGTDIGIDRVINQDNINEMLPLRKYEPNHPPSNYFLKLLQLICEDFNWKYFSKEDHDMFLKTGFPHGVNEK